MPFLLMVILNAQMIPMIIMSVWNVPEGAKWFSYYWINIPSVYSPVAFAWMAQLMTHDAEGRSLLFGGTIAIYYAFTSWSTVLIWPAKEAPHYKHGWQTSLGLLPFAMIMAGVLKWYDKRYV